MHTLGALHRDPVLRAGWKRPGDRQLGIDARDVEDRRRLQIENCRVLAEVRDLDHAAAARAVVDQEGLVALAAEVHRRAFETEEPRGDPRDFIRRESRRPRLEHAHHASP